LLADWQPVSPGSPWAAPIYSRDGGHGVLFVTTADRIFAVGPGSGIGDLALFVDRGSDRVKWLGWQEVPGGGVVAFSYHANDHEAYILVARLFVSP
jgi:hypothetical protein